MTDERILTPTAEPEDLQAELSLRPKMLREYIGQHKVKANLEISLTAARKRGEALDHVLLFGLRDSARPHSRTSSRTK